MYDDLVTVLRKYSCPKYSDGCGMCPAFKDGCAIRAVQQAADAIEELSKPRWIPVSERLPLGGDDSGAICENVCLLMDDGTVSCGWMNGIMKKVYYLNAIDDVVIKAPITRVTHWMPLPEPPKEE